MLTLAYVTLFLALTAGLIAARGAFVRLPERFSVVLSLMAWGFLSIGLVQRGWEAGHWPIAGRYEFALSWAWVILALSFLLAADRGMGRDARGHLMEEQVKPGTIRHPERSPGAFPGRSEGSLIVSALNRLSISPWSLAAALLVLTYAMTFPDAQKAATPLSPVLRSPWLQIHALSALLAYGASAVAAGLAVELLLSPESVQEQQALRMVAICFTWLTLSILAGMIWAQDAWGRYWDWDIKEVWAFGTWLWYLFLLHVRPFPRWRGRRMAWLMIAGFALVCFTFVGVPWLVHWARVETLHGT